MDDGEQDVEWLKNVAANAVVPLLGGILGLGVWTLLQVHTVQIALAVLDARIGYVESKIAGLENTITWGTKDRFTGEDAETELEKRDVRIRRLEAEIDNLKGGK